MFHARAWVAATCDAGIRGAAANGHSLQPIAVITTSSMPASLIEAPGQSPTVKRNMSVAVGVMISLSRNLLTRMRLVHTGAWAAYPGTPSAVHQMEVRRRRSHVTVRNRSLPSV